MGDLVHLRPNLTIDFVGVGASYKVYMNMGIGSDEPRTLDMLNSERKSTDLFNDSHFIGFDITNENIKNFPAEVYILTDADATVKVNGWYIEIIRKNINVVDITSDLGYVPENLDNKQNNLSPDGQGVKYPTVDAVNDGLKIETGASPSITTVTVGGVPAGTDIQNLTFNSLLTDILIAYLYPQFTAKACNYPSLVEVGTQVNGIYTFTWAVSNGTNIVPNSVNIFDLNANNFLVTGLDNDGSEAVALNGNTLNANNATQVWQISAENTKSEVVESGNIVTTAIYPIFYGVANSQPTANQALINGGTKAIVTSTGTLNITFGGSGQYLWFAHPALNPTKTKWYVNALNNGNIGSISDLFNAPTTVSITTVMWAGVSYKVYISNIPTTTSGNMELKNS